MTRSFLHYYLNRVNPDDSFSEMAAAPATFKGSGKEEKVEEARKTPIFIDNDDIKFLQQFPPSLWKQALAWRYDELLEDAWNAKQKNKQIADVQNVRLRYRGGRTGGYWVIFPKVQTGANELLDRVTADVDDALFSRLTPGQKDAYLNHAKKKKLGSLGYVLSGIKKNQNMGASDGYVFPSEKTMRDRLASLYKAHEEGWYGEHPETKTMNFGGGGKRNLPVYSPEELQKLPGHDERYEVDDEGKRVWWAFREDNGKPISVAEYLPKIQPGVMIPTNALAKYRKRMDIHQQIENDFKSDRLEDYLQAYNNPEDLDKAIERLKAIRGTDRQEVQRLLNIASMMKRLHEFVKRQGDDPKHLDEQQFKAHLQGFSEWLRSSAKEIQKNSPRYDVTDWNMHHFNPRFKNPHTSWTGFGTWNPNWQQPERVHGGLKKLGIDPQEFWNSIKGYVVQHGAAAGEEEGEVPYTKSFENDAQQVAMGALARGINAYLKRGGVYQTPSWYAMMKNWWEVFDNATDYLKRRLGSSYFLDYARWLKSQKDKTQSDVNVSAAQARMTQGAYQAGYNYAGMIFQLKSRMGGGVAPGVDMASILDDPSVQTDMAAMGGAIVSKWNRKYRPENPNFATDQDHGRTSHAISTLHNVIDQDLQQMSQSPEVTAAIDQAISKESGTTSSVVGQMGTDASAKEKQLAKNIIDTGLAFMVYRHIFIHQKNQKNEPWTIQQANEFASRALDKWLQKRGVKQFGGKIDFNSDSKGSYDLAKRQSEEEGSYRKQLSDMGYQDKIAEKESDKTAPTQNNPASDQAEKLMMLTKLIDDVDTLRQLHPKSKQFNPKLRKFYEQIVQNRTLGWPIIKILLKRVDQLPVKDLVSQE